MNTENVKDRNVHQGTNVRRIRQYEGMKQETLANELGVNQQCISRLEQQPVIKKEYMEKIAAILKVTPEIIENMEETPISVVIENNNFENGGIGYIGEVNELNQHPLEKIIELTKENTSLYERMLANEKEKAALLEKLLNEKK